MAKNGSTRAPLDRTSFGIAYGVLERLRLARVMTDQPMQKIAEAAIDKYLDELGVPKTVPRVKEKR